MTTVGDLVPTCSGECGGRGLSQWVRSIRKGAKAGKPGCREGVQQDRWEERLQRKTGHVVKATQRRLALIQETPKVLKKLWLRTMNLIVLRETDQRVQTGGRKPICFLYKCRQRV